jgi:hypothetical protein
MGSRYAHLVGYADEEISLFSKNYVDNTAFKNVLKK